MKTEKYTILFVHNIINITTRIRGTISCYYNHHIEQFYIVNSLDGGKIIVDSVEGVYNINEGVKKETYSKYIDYSSSTKQIPAMGVVAYIDFVKGV